MSKTNLPALRGVSAAQLRLPRRSFLASVAGLAAVAGGSRFALAQGAGRSPAIGERDADTLVVLVDATIENLDPATNVEWAYGLRPVYETLMELDGSDTLSARPKLATSVRANDDKTVWTFTLPEGVTFHDGTPCDADAVRKAIIRLVTHPWGLASTWQLDDPNSQVVAKDATTLELTFAEPRPYFDREAAAQYGFAFASPTAAETHSLGADDMGSEYLQSNPVGTGPYRLTSLNPGQDATFEKFDAYRGGWNGPHFSRVITRTVPLSATRRQLLEAGEVDIVLQLEPEDMVELAADDRFTVSSTKTCTMQFVSFATDGRLADPRIRQAICHAFDHESYIRDVTLNTADKPLSLFPSILDGAPKSDILLPYDPDKARSLLREAGAEGMELTYTYYSGFGDVEGQLLQAWLAEIGLTLKLQEKSFSAFLDDFFGDAPAAERSDLFYFSWWPNVDHPYSWAWTLFSGESTSLDGNSGRYANAEATDLIAGFRNQIVDDAMRTKIERLAEIITVEDPAWLPMQEERTAFVVRNDIEGLVQNPIYVATFDMYALSRSAS